MFDFLICKRKKVLPIFFVAILDHKAFAIVVARVVDLVAVAPGGLGLNPRRNLRLGATTIQLLTSDPPSSILKPTRSTTKLIR